MYCHSLFISLPNDKILDWSKLQAFADDKCGKKIKFVVGRIGNIVGKGEMLVTSFFSFSHNAFKRLLFQGH